MAETRRVVLLFLALLSVFAIFILWTPDVLLSPKEVWRLFDTVTVTNKYSLGATSSPSMSTETPAKTALETKTLERVVHSKRTNRTLNITIATFVSRSDFSKYDIAIKSVQCYCMLHGYNHRILRDSPKYEKDCPQKEVMFKRHCIIAHVIPDSDYTLVVDADTGIVNPEKLIEEYIDPEYDIILYERFYAYEVSAASMLLKNRSFSISFLNRLADYEAKLPASNTAHNFDNGALHMLIGELFFTNNTHIKSCRALWDKGRSWSDYFPFVTCFFMLIGDQRMFSNKIKILRKGKGWARDHFVTAERWSPQRDFMVHGWKSENVRPDSYKMVPPVTETGLWSKWWVNPFKKPLGECSENSTLYSWKTEWIASNEEIEKRLAVKAEMAETSFRENYPIVINFLKSRGS